MIWNHWNSALNILKDAFSWYDASVQSIRKAFIIILLSLSTLSLGAVSFGAGITGGYRVSDERVPYNGELTLSISDFTLWTRVQGDERVDISLEYGGNTGNTIEHIVNLHTAIYPSLGWFADAEYEFTQTFRWSFFSIGYGLGLQLSVLWSDLLGDPLFAISPIIDANIGFHFGPVDFIGYLTMDHIAEREFKALPVIGATLSWRIGGHSTIYADAYLKMAEYLMDPTTMISGWAVRVGYIYRGRIV